MKKLWIIRHAKSSWDDPGITDHDRPLNDRGKLDAPRVASYLMDHFDIPDRCYTSSAKRAKRTCKVFRKTFDIKKSKVTVLPMLYHPTIQSCMQVIHSIDESIDCAAIFGHNPTFTYLIHELTGTGPDNLPTCGCALVTSSAEYWSTFESDQCNLDALIFPKMLPS